jgi:hypothetical protein
MGAATNRPSGTVVADFRRCGKALWADGPVLQEQKMHRFASEQWLRPSSARLWAGRRFEPMVMRTALPALAVLGLFLSTARAEAGSPNVASDAALAPAATANTGGVQAGVGVTITPSQSGVVLLLAQMTGKNGTAGDGASVQFDYGVGSCPANGVIAPPFGWSMVGQYQTMTSTNALEEQALHLSYVLTGLTLGVQYCVDIVQAAVYGGVAQLYDVNVTAIELVGAQ